MDDFGHLEAVCQAIARQLEDLARQRCAGEISEDAFIRSVLEIEAAEVTPVGLTLTASESHDHWTVFQLKVNGSNTLCAGFEFLPETGEFRRTSRNWCQMDSGNA